MTSRHGEEKRMLQRYAHVRRALPWRPRCGAPCPRSGRACTLEQRHTGPHIAHGLLGRARAVWPASGEGRGAARKGRRPPAPRSGGAPQSGGLERGLRRLVGWLGRIPDHLEGVFLLVLFLGFVWFVLDWFLRIAAGG